MRAQDQALDGAPLVRLMLDVLVALQIAQQRRCDLFIAVAAVVLEDRGEREGYVAPALVWLDWCNTGLLQIEIEVFEVAGMRDDLLALRAEVGSQIGDALQPARSRRS